MAYTADLFDQVQAAIAKVNDALTRAVNELDGAWFKSDAQDHALAQLRGTVTSAVAAWAKSGDEAAASPMQLPPGGGGWAGWIAAGNALESSIADYAAWSSAERLDNLKLTAEQTAASVATATKKAAAIVQTAAVATGATVGETLGAATKPLAMPLGLVAVGLVAVAAIVWGRK